MSVRPARADDEAPLLRIDRATWSTSSSPAPEPPSGPFFNGGSTRLDNVLVAEVEGRVAGYAKMDPATPLPASAHVFHVTGIAVDPELEGRGAGRALMEALMDSARKQGGRRMTLRVFAPNKRARRMYERLGFVTEGVLRGEFRQGDEFIDDVLMAREL